MRVAFDEQIFAIQRHGGISRVFAELAHQFIADPSLGVEVQPVAAPLVNEYILKDPYVRDHLVVSESYHWAPALTRSLLRRRHRGPADIVHNTFYFPRALTDYPGAKRVVTVHDMIPELFPDSKRRLDFLTAKRRYVEQADHIVCVSQSTKNDLIQLYGKPKAPISVIHSGVGSEFHPGQPRMTGWPDDYLLYVGHRRGYKDASTLLRAFAHIARSSPKLHLIFVGGGGLSRSELRLVHELMLDGRVRHESVRDAQMPAAYSHARAFIFPSRYEGFGIPVLEAMACGTPTVLCQSSSLPEVGGTAAMYFDPGEDGQLAAAIEMILNDRAHAQDLAHRGIDRAKQFTWRSTAEQLAGTYRLMWREGRS